MSGRQSLRQATQVTFEPGNLLGRAVVGLQDTSPVGLPVHGELAGCGGEPGEPGPPLHHVPADLFHVGSVGADGVGEGGELALRLLGLVAGGCQFGLQGVLSCGGVTGGAVHLALCAGDRLLCGDHAVCVAGGPSGVEFLLCYPEFAGGVSGTVLCVRGLLLRGGGLVRRLGRGVTSGLGGLPGLVGGLGEGFGLACGFGHGPVVSGDLGLVDGPHALICHGSLLLVQVTPYFSRHQSGADSRVAACAVAAGCTLTTVPGSGLGFSFLHRSTAAEGPQVRVVTDHAPAAQASRVCPQSGQRERW